MSNGTCVIDTNVVLVANKEFADASTACVQQCARRLRQVCLEGHVAVDDGMRIFNEYRNKTLTRSGQREAGDEFVLWLISNLWNTSRCTQVPLTLEASSDGNFEEFPDHEQLRRFDRSDRVFVAVACAHPDRPPVLAACDTDYWECRAAFNECGVSIEFLCTEDVQRLAERKDYG